MRIQEHGDRALYITAFMDENDPHFLCRSSKQLSLQQNTIVVLSIQFFSRKGHVINVSVTIINQRCAIQITDENPHTDFCLTVSLIVP